jgi:hypothetical protein
MKTLVRVLALIASALVIAAATHLNVESIGGYRADGAPLVIAVPLLLAAGMAYAGSAYSDGQRLLAVLAMFCMFSGELYWLAKNAEREMGERERVSAPSRGAVADYRAAEKRVERAEKAATKADEAMLTEAAKPGCAKNCRALLEGAQIRASAELDSANRALASLPRPDAIAPLPEKLGIEPWQWDLGIAGLRGVCILGAALIIGMGLHPKRKVAQGNHINPSNSSAPAPSLQVAHLAPVPAKLGAIKAGSLKASTPYAAKVVPIRPAAGNVAAYLKARTLPASGASVALAELRADYLGWCAMEGLDPVPARTFVETVRRALEQNGLKAVVDGQDVRCMGLKLAS